MSKHDKSATYSRASDAGASDRRLWTWGAGAAGAALAATAVVNHRRARRAERDNPPLGQFVTVDGVRLHYVERGEGEPLLLLHGNGAMIEDWEASGLLDELAGSHRVIAIDRPGFGHSDRPRTTIWTPAAQAKLIAAALPRIGVKRPLVVGHSFGTMVALALALDHPSLVNGLVLLGGYYYPSARADVLFASQPAVPVLGDVMRYTISPLLGAALQPKIRQKIFAPAPVPDKFELFPMEMALRPSQIRATAAEAALMVPAAAALAGRYADLGLPLTLAAGRGDRLVDPLAQSARLHEAVAGSRLELIEGSGHMVHYTAMPRVAELIRDAAKS
ncbi:MAG TPA: alpha/beta hydrolase [Allosphingosinicella sp.]|jgi:pimeloyl-ACP methyl ester carboxylesterase